MASNTDDTTIQDDQPRTIIRDPVFYFDLAILQVENHLFRIPIHTLIAESGFFKTMFELPSPESSPPDGGSDEQPIVIPDVTHESFRQLLRILFPPKWDKDEPLTLTEWVSVLSLATKFEFDNVRTVAVRRMANMFPDPIEKVRFGNQCGVDEWVLSGLNALVSRPNPLTYEEGHRIGFKAFVKIAAIRETRGDQWGNPAGSRDYTREIKRVFGL